jgi:hypothetical protein
MERYPDDLKNHVLKPLHSFAGAEVEIDLTKAMLDALSPKQGFLLQRKVEYAPLIETPEGYARAEIRLMYLWDKKPLLVNNLVRMSKSPMMGMAYNKDKTWIGSSLAYHS